MSGLCHRFVNGLRARTEVECRVKTAAGHWRYACLHREVEIPAASASVAWMQAARLLCGWRPETTGSTQVDLAGLADPIELAQQCQPGIVCEAVPMITPQPIGERVLQAVLENAVPIIQYGDGQHTRWSTVCGVELLDGVAQALLLLDARLPGPWGVAYNARLELASVARASPQFLALRATDGQSWRVSLQQLFIARAGASGRDVV
ncbi:hypothetical protein [Aquabacterium sp. A08]|uniref:hypothetical protein n=1 Tax=Aquabacterium sp. A08 TaxID=2718532 RepID=UPI001422B26B|nr:hypothetical protein [Aquabacterium sp. A08]NIC42299.1 hypothetical protein [Aquabacterium sp. A08]NIC42311.1 hypothetical protein [Aquabacterium sp. A08]